MTWAVIDLCEEIKARIEQAVSSGSLACKDIFIGNIEQIRKPNDLPICVILPLKTRGIAEHMRHGISDECTINIVYIVPYKTVNDNKLYKASDTSGVLYEIPKILNYLEKKTTDGTIDLTFNGKAFNLSQYDISYDYSADDTIRVIISFTAKTAVYQRGAR